MRAALDTLYRLSGWASALLIAGICALVTAQVALNAADKIIGALGMPALGLTIPSYSDFTGFFLAGASFLALASTMRAGGHIRVALVLDRLPPAPRRWVEALCLAAAAGVALFFTWFIGALATESWHFNDLSSGMVAVPLWIPQAVMTVGLAVLSVALLDDLAAVLAGRTPSYADKGENLLSGEPDLSGEV
jgi:TRAP-type C4-dicarboxylate transport system permease small subunit